MQWRLDPDPIHPLPIQIPFQRQTLLTPWLNTNANANANANSSANPGEYVYGNKADKVGFYPNETNTQYSSYASYDANLDNRAKFLDRESKGLVQQQQQQQPQQQ